MAKAKAGAKKPRKLIVTKLRPPENKELLAAVGVVAIAHGQLEYILRMIVRTLGGLSITEALDAMQFKPMIEVRKEIRRLFSELTNDAALRLKMDALLERVRKESEQRNQLLHRPWALDQENQPLMKDEYHQWGPTPNIEKFNKLSERIYDLIREMNEARFAGFIYEVANSRKSEQPA